MAFLFDQIQIFEYLTNGGKPVEKTLVNELHQEKHREFARFREALLG
jgi:hypothetical protein